MHGLHSFFFFKEKTEYELRISDWSSDVCSSDLVRGATQNAKSRGIFAVEAELLAQRIRDRSASFLRNQHGGGDVPFVTPADSCDKVRLIGSHHRHPERDAVGLVHLCQVEIHLGQLVSGHTCAWENLAAARYQRLAVAPCAFSLLRDPEFPPGRRGEKAQHRLTLFHQRDGHRPSPPSAQIIARAVNRVDDPYAFVAKPHQIVSRLFR